MDYNSLQHHGVKGQRWGVRRYQNKDGSLTSAGKKRRSMSEVVKDVHEAVKQKQAKNAEEKERLAVEQRKQDILDGKIKSKDMTEAELKSRIERLKLEDNYNTYMNKYPKEVSRGERIVNQYVGPAAKKILWDTAVDLTAQTVKVAFAKSVNEAIGETDKDGNIINVVFANNKKKS